VFTDNFYAECVCLRSLPVDAFLAGTPLQSPLPITSINENRLLMEIGLPLAERNQIEGLQMRRAPAAGLAHHGNQFALTEEQLSSRAISRLAANPPLGVGTMQRRTICWLLRPFPLGLRFSGKNMSPLPCWLSGAQSVALNMSNNDHSVQFHHALFNRSTGYVLKPSEMRPGNALSEDDEHNDEAYWPPPRKKLCCVTLTFANLHNLPKIRERRPRFGGARSDCHKHVPELSGAAAPPTNTAPSSPSLVISVHAIGGFCAVSKTLPVPQNAEAELKIATVKENGMNATLDQIVYCVAAEPLATLLRIGVTDFRQEVAYDTSVLGRLRHGYRVMQLRGILGTRIELAYVFVRITIGTVQNLWVSPRQVRLTSMFQNEELAALRLENGRLNGTLKKMQATVESSNADGEETDANGEEKDTLGELRS